jgi:hypothetical protein
MRRIEEIRTNIDLPKSDDVKKLREVAEAKNRQL